MEILVCTFGRWCKILYMAFRHFRCDQLVLICKKGLYDKVKKKKDPEEEHVQDLRDFMNSGLISKEKIRFLEVEDLNDYWECMNIILPGLL